MESVLSQILPDKLRASTFNYYSYSDNRGIGIIPAVQFHIQIPHGSIQNGRVLLFITNETFPEPRLALDAIDNRFPCFAKDVNDITSTSTIIMDSREFSEPGAISYVPSCYDLDKDNCVFQIVVHQDVCDPDPTTCIGNFYSLPQKFLFEEYSKDSSGIHIIQVNANQQIQPPKNHFGENWIQTIKIKSTSLSAFHQKDIYLEAAVILPYGYDPNSTQLLPTVYYIEGFGGTENYRLRADHFLSSEMGKLWQKGEWPCPMLRVVLGSRSRYGHTSFVDSEVNGPWASALVTELIPAIESRFKANPHASARFITGHSSGGWSCLWLQINFPDTFGGAWSSAPDPVDFHHFQLVDLYSADNMYWDKSGRAIPTCRTNGSIDCSIREENLIERVLGKGNGGQWDSWFAVFGSQSMEEENVPIPLFNKLSGEINPEVVKQWSKFDMCQLLEEKWDILGKQIEGKLHVVCGIEDNYYLEKACRSLQRLLKEKAPNSSSYVKLVPGDHSTIKSKAFYTNVFNEIAETYRLSFPTSSTDEIPIDTSNNSDLPQNS